METKKDIKMFYIIFVLLFLFASMFYTLNVIGSNIIQIPILLTSVVAAMVAYFHGYNWFEIKMAILDGINIALEGVLIILIIGMLIGSWIAAGTVQTIIVYGLKLVSAKWFLPISFLVSSIASTAIGSSWAVIGTIGIALMAIGTGLGIDSGIVAGAIVSGGVLGNTISPLGDNANIVSAAVKINLFDHIRVTLYSVLPGAIVCFLIYLVIGFKFQGATADYGELNIVIDTLKSNYFIHPILLLPVIAILICSFLRVPSIPSLLIVTGIACLFGFVFQGESVDSMYKIVYSGYVGNTGVIQVDNMITRGGMESMFYNITIAFSALSLSGILEHTNMLNNLIESLNRFLKTRLSIVMLTMATSYLTVLAMANQYMSLIMPGRMYEKVYRKKGYELSNLTRALASSGGLLDGIIPWTLTGVFVPTVLEVTAFEYGPYTFIVFLVPLFTIFYGATGIFFPEVKIESD